MLKNLTTSVLLTLFSTASFAASSISLNTLGARIEPIAGLETVYRETPNPHTSTRTIYGARVTLGSDAIAGELEYTHGSDTEKYSQAPEKIYHEDDKAKLGLRSTYRFTDLFFVTGRLGGQGNRGFKEETSGGVVTRTEKPIKYYPYAGASLGLRFGSLMSLSAGTTVVFADSSDMSKNEIQNTLSLSIGVN